MTDQKERPSWQSSTNPTIPLARPLAKSASYASDSQSETFVHDEVGNRARSARLSVARQRHPGSMVRQSIKV
jgi:hypothetical protein